LKWWFESGSVGESLTGPKRFYRRQKIEQDTCQIHILLN
jgi:hypothetical protein